MAKYLNGYDAPLFRIWMPSSSNWHDISLKLRYQALTESLNIKYIEHKLIDGSYSRKFEYVEYFWTLDYSALAESDEIIKLIQILNHLQLDRTVLLKPHKEQTRSFYIIDDSKEYLSLGEHYGGAGAPGNKDLVFKFKSKIQMTNPGNSVLWHEVSTGIPNQESSNVKFLTDEDDNYILTETNELILI
jgi:hypothetical protein